MLFFGGGGVVVIKFFFAVLTRNDLFVFLGRVRMISLAAQKFVSDIANDALQHCKMRGSGQSSRKSGKVCHCR